jgi:hypothetical protein
MTRLHYGILLGLVGAGMAWWQRSRMQAAKPHASSHGELIYSNTPIA